MVPLFQTYHDMCEGVRLGKGVRLQVLPSKDSKSGGCRRDKKAGALDFLHLHTSLQMLMNNEAVMGDSNKDIPLSSCFDVLLLVLELKLFHIN